MHQAPCPIQHAQHVAQAVIAHEAEHGPVHVASPYHELTVSDFATAINEAAIAAKREALASRNRIQ